MKKRHKNDGKPKIVPNANEIVLKYGTYEIQPTADTDNDFPKIAQGLSKSNTNNQEPHQPK